MESELMLSILSGFAAEESASISQNSTWSIQKRFQNGSYVGTPPYGYTNIDGEMVIVPEEAEIIKRIFAECLSGKGGGTIARGLNKDKIPARRGNHWSAGTVIDMLRKKNIWVMSYCKRLTPIVTTTAIQTQGKKTNTTRIIMNLL